MVSFLFITQIILTIFIVILVLLQKSSGGGLVNYSGSNDSVFGAKGPAGFMAKVTLCFGALFLANTIALSYFYAKGSQKSIVDDIKVPLQTQEAPSAPTLQDKLNTLTPKNTKEQ